jgi:hypothetical protein
VTHSTDFLASPADRAKLLLSRVKYWGIRRLSFASLGAITLVLVAFVAGEAAFAKGNELDQHWVGTWRASPGLASTTGFNNQTVRMIVHTSIGGDDVRVRLSNAFGTKPLVIGAAHVVLHSGGGAIVRESDRALTFGGVPSTTIPAGALVVSDPVELHVRALSNLAVSIYLPGDTGPATAHDLAVQTNYISAPGDYTDAPTMPAATTIQAWFFVSGVEVKSSQRTKAIVTFGDSITDGYCSTLDANRRWPNILAERLLASKRHSKLAVLDEGISGNRVLHDGLVPAFGPNALCIRRSRSCL